jgi:hypothetical protein
MRNKNTYVADDLSDVLKKLKKEIEKAINNK